MALNPNDKDTHTFGETKKVNDIVDNELNYMFDSKSLPLTIVL